MYHPSHVFPFVLLFASLLLSNCQPSGDNANTNANTNANAVNVNTPTNTADVERAPRPTPVTKPARTGEFCKVTVLENFTPDKFKRVDSSDTSCVTVTSGSAAGQRVAVSYHCIKKGCTANVTVSFDDGSPSEVYPITCAP